MVKLSISWCPIFKKIYLMVVNYFSANVTPTTGRWMDMYCIVDIKYKVLKMWEIGFRRDASMFDNVDS